MKKCNDLLKEYIEQAKENENFSKNIREEKVIEEYRICLKFLADEELIHDAKDRLEAFKAFLNQAVDMINAAKQYSQLNRD